MTFACTLQSITRMNACSICQRLLLPGAHSCTENTWLLCIRHHWLNHCNWERWYKTVGNAIPKALSRSVKHSNYKWDGKLWKQGRESHSAGKREAPWPLIGNFYEAMSDKRVNSMCNGPMISLWRSPWNGSRQGWWHPVISVNGQSRLMLRNWSAKHILQIYQGYWHWMIGAYPWTACQGCNSISDGTGSQ